MLTELPGTSVPLHRKVWSPGACRRCSPDMHCADKGKRVTETAHFRLRFSVRRNAGNKAH